MNFFISESKLRQIIKEAIVNEVQQQSVKPGTAFKVGSNNPKIMAKVLAKQYGINPNDLDYNGISLVYNPRKKTRRKISKPEGMSVEQYVKDFVLPNNPKMSEDANMYPDEKWKPVQNAGRYFKGGADFSEIYEVSNYGRIRLINFKDAEKSKIYRGYEAPTRNAMQYHLNTVDAAGNTQKTCPDMKYIVADAWLEPKDPNKYMVIQKDGDWRNNRVDNLMWIPKSEGRRERKIKK